MLRPNKITIVGADDIGMSCAVGILSKKLTCHLTLIDQNESKVIGEALDLLHASIYMDNVKILAGKDYVLSSKSVLCIVTSSVEQQPDESEIDFLHRYVETYKWILPNLLEHSPDTIIVVVGNPIGIITFAAWKISRLPKNRIIGVASSLNTSKFRCRAASTLDISASNVIGWAIEQNALFSSLTVGGVILCELNTPDLEKMNDPERVDGSGKIIENWAIALNCREIAVAIIKNTNQVYAVATCAKGLLGITGDVFLSLPCIIGQNGIIEIINISPSDDEMQLLKPIVDKLDKLNLKIALL